mmetsp:Transcript_32843/g.83113  ORF Transcript_32843/g.83113 Transcript_32843/m.83113 type:complete len:302 (+) Transcript_32843:637-1542(+)
MSTEETDHLRVPVLPRVREAGPTPGAGAAIKRNPGNALEQREDVANSRPIVVMSHDEGALLRNPVEGSAGVVAQLCVLLFLAADELHLGGLEPHQAEVAQLSHGGAFFHLHFAGDQPRGVHRVDGALRKDSKPTQAKVAKLRQEFAVAAVLGDDHIRTTSVLHAVQKALELATLRLEAPLGEAEVGVRRLAEEVVHATEGLLEVVHEARALNLDLAFLEPKVLVVLPDCLQKVKQARRCEEQSNHVLGKVLLELLRFHVLEELEDRPSQKADACIHPEEQQEVGPALHPAEWRWHKPVEQP